MPNSKSDKPVEAYTDGACSGNPGPGGWAWATKSGQLGSGGEPTTTNQRMELQAVLEVVRAIEGPITIYSDSTYVVNCFNDRWYEGWLKRDWKNSQKKPVANRDIWEPLVEEYLKRQDELTFVWVKGHSGNKMNDLVDSMAVAESTEQKERLAAAGPLAADAVTADATAADAQGVSGSGASLASNGPAAAPVSGPPPPWPIDQAVWVTGISEPNDEQVEALTEVVEGLNPAYDLLISGLRRGAELLAAEVAVSHGIPLGVVLPFANPAARWPAPLLERFETCISAADWVITLEGDPATPSTAVAARNEWLWSAVVGAIIVGDDKLVTQLDNYGLGVIPID